MPFPEYRGQRRRAKVGLRRLFAETRIGPEDLIAPLFVVDGEGVREEIPHLPGLFRLSVDRLADPIRSLRELGVGAVLIYGLASVRDELAREALRVDNVVVRAVRAIRAIDETIVTITDVSLSAYLPSGREGIFMASKRAGAAGGRRDHGRGASKRRWGRSTPHRGAAAGRGDPGREDPRREDAPGDDTPIDHDATLEVLAEMALTHARAGVDLLSPSSGLDGQVAFLRETLDEEDMEHVGLIPVAVPYGTRLSSPIASVASGSSGSSGRGARPSGADASHLSFANSREALMEVEQDLDEGADMVGITPALASLDVIARLRDETPIPIVAFSGAGEYQMIQAAAARGWIDGAGAALDSLLAIKRAGADAIVTLFAEEVARDLATR